MRIFLIFLVLGIAYADHHAAPNAKVQKELDAIADRWRAAYEVGDFAAMADLYEPDTWLMTRNRPAKKSRDAVLQYFEQSRAVGGKAEIVFDQESLIVDPPYAFKTAHWWLEVEGSGGQLITDQGRSFVVFKQGSDGRWRIWRDMDNNTPDVQPRELSRNDAP
ncbi:MAG: DUF4440 domain-containing protein [Pseudomonadota bacterium]